MKVPCSFPAPRMLGAAVLMSSCTRPATGTERSAFAAPPPMSPAEGIPGPAASTSSVYLVGPRRWRAVVTVREPTARAIQEAVIEPGPHRSWSCRPAATRSTLPSSSAATMSFFFGAGAGSMDLGSTADGSAATLVSAPASASDRPLVRVIGARRFEISGLRFEGVADEGSRGKDVGLLSTPPDFASPFLLRSYGIRRGAHQRDEPGRRRLLLLLRGVQAGHWDRRLRRGRLRHERPHGRRPGAAVARWDPEATVVEDSRLSLCRHAIASNKGGRYVFRNNYVTSGVVAHAIDAHGAESDWRSEAIGSTCTTISSSSQTTACRFTTAGPSAFGAARAWCGTTRFGVIASGSSSPRRRRSGAAPFWGNQLEPPGHWPMRVAAEGRCAGVPLGPPPGYRAHPHPHPLVVVQCGPRPPTRIGSADVCPID